MTREWRPGDVAHVAGGRAFFTNRYGWTFFDGSTARDGVNARVYHPLVVIDPEDHEQVVALRDRLLYEGVEAGSIKVADHPDFDYDAALTAKLHRALRALIAPDKPPEPTGRYAVVIDDKGIEWLRDKAGNWWNRPDTPYPLWREWDLIAAVEVLSEGVQ